ncbi:WecE Predicted pyridoxal phosphate-dependent enzyme apparently involved in regulation of cell wall biogenesis [Candidatus Nanopelagicaceae bacterium]
MKLIPLAKPQISREERTAVNRVLRTLNLAQGPEVKNFENEFSKFVEDRECVAVNSGTSALHLCLIALGIGPGDEVIVPSFTFAATANVVSLVGATPIFVDIDPKTYCLDPLMIKDAITTKTRAIIVVHLYGLPADMKSICRIADENSLLVIEDAAQAHIASIDGKLVGTFGDAAAFSFYPTKNMTSGEGGMAVLKESSIARVCRLLRNQGMEKRYQNEIVGFNLRMTDIHAAIGRVQLRKLPKMTERRIENANYLSANLAIDTVPFVGIGYRHVFHQYTVRLKNSREEFSGKLIENGIGNDVYYPTQVHMLPSFNAGTELPETLAATQQVLSLPVHPGLSRRDLNKIVSRFNKIIEEQGS